MSCQDLDLCLTRAEKWLKYQKAFLDDGDSELEKLRKELRNEKKWLKLTSHAEKRLFFRAISERDVKLLVKEVAWPFEYHKNIYGNEKLGLIGYPGKNRPLHIILKRNKGENDWKLITVYDPRSEEFRWNKDYTERICFCPKEKGKS